MPDFISRPQTLNTYFDKIFYINLQKDTVRNEHIIRAFKRFGITNYERIDAVKLTEYPEQKFYRNFIKGQPKYILGQLSCRASHLKCISIAKERNYFRILIFEDDIVFLEDPNKLLQLNYDALKDWDMLYFGGDVEAFYRNQIVRTHAYAIKNTLYDDIINMADASGMEIDNFYAKILQHMSYNYNRSGKYNIRTILPFNTVAPDDRFGTNIHQPLNVNSI